MKIMATVGIRVFKTFFCSPMLALCCSVEFIDARVVTVNLLC